MTAPKSIAICLGFCLALPFGLQAQTTYRWVDQDGRVTYSDQPPPPKVRAAEEKRLGAANAISSGGPDYSTRVAAQSSPVTLYSSADCAAPCKLARDFLKQQGIPYSEKTLKTSEDAAAFKSATGGEDLLVPSLVVGALSHKGFEEGAWRQLLDAAGYPRAGATPAPQ